MTVKNFQHMTYLFRGASRKTSALARVTPFMNLSKRRLLMNSFFKSQFNFCPLIWMCQSCENNRKINPLHGRYLKTIQNDKQLPLNKLLVKDGSVSIHEQNLQILATEMYKISHGLSTPLMKDIFPINRNPRINTVYHGTESISNKHSVPWD